MVIQDQGERTSIASSIHSVTVPPSAAETPVAAELHPPDNAPRSIFQSLLGKEGAHRPLPAPKPDTNNATYEAMCQACSDPSWLRYRGPAYTVLPTYSDFIKPPFRQVHALPKPEYIASNYTPDATTEELYYVNGMCYGPQAIERHLSSLVKTFGKPVTAIINDQESDLVDPKKPGFFKSLWHSTCGFLSANFGHAVEPAAVERVEHAIQEHARSGKPLHCIAHSQGSIIVANALERMLGPESPLTQIEKERVYSVVRISTFGAAEHYFPTGVRVQEYAHRGDAVTHVTALLADIREWGRDAFQAVSTWGTSMLGLGAKLFGGQVIPETAAPARARAPVVYLDGDHDFGPFLEKLPSFFIKKAGGDTMIGGALVAHDLSRSITTARLSDMMHGLIIREMIHRGDGVFARTFLELHPAGIVGNFTIPFMAELRALAER